MTNYKKIKSILETGTCRVAVYFGDNKVLLFSSVMENGNLRESYVNKNMDVCYDSLGATWVTEKDINEWNDISKIVPLPISHKPLPNNYLCEIIDCEELREIARVNIWIKEKIDMIGKKGLKIECFKNNCDGESYEIYTEDKCDTYILPARFIIPFIEDKDEKADEAIAYLTSIGKIKDGKILI